MKNKLQKLKALAAQSQRITELLARKEAFEDLFLMESGRFLLGDMKEQRDADRCVGVFDEFFIECDLSHRLAPSLAFEICQNARAEGILLPFFTAPTAGRPLDICFVKNRFSEEALPLLEKETTLYYAESFEEACALTAEGRRDGCLLPFMGEDRLPLQGILRLIDEYDLKKHRSFLIDNGSQNTLYLLLTGRLYENPAAECLELLCEGSRKEIEGLLALCDPLGLKASLPAPLSGRSTPSASNETLFCRFTLEGRQDALLLFANSARLCLARSLVTGLYDRVELLEE